MDFFEAEQRFRVLEDQRARSILTLEQYRAELNLLRVQDSYGRLWMQQEQTGQWFVHHNGNWQAAMPPHHAAPASQGTLVPERPSGHQQPVASQNLSAQGGGVSFNTPTSTSPSAQPIASMQSSSGGISFDPTPEQAANLHAQPAGYQPQVNAPLPRIGKAKPAQVHRAATVAYAANQARAGKRKGMGCAGTLMTFLIAFPLVWIIVGVVIYYLSGEDEQALIGVAAAAALSLLIMTFNALQKWQGTIKDIRTVRESSTDDDGYTSYRNVTYAFVQKPNGRTKKIHNLRQWQVGDYLEKRRGEFGIRHYPR